MMENMRKVFGKREVSQQEEEMRKPESVRNVEELKRLKDIEIRYRELHHYVTTGQAVKEDRDLYGKLQQEIADIRKRRGMEPFNPAKE